VPLQDRLIRAADRAKAPVFLIQGENDYSRAPSRALSKEASKMKKDFQSKSIQHSVALIRMGTGDFAPRPPMSGETTYWPFLKRTQGPLEITAIDDPKDLYVRLTP